MSNVTQSDPQFGAYLAGFMHDMLRAAGITMSATIAFEKVRTAGDRMALTIEAAAERKAIQVASKLQNATIAGFDLVEEKLNDLNERLKALEEPAKQREMFKAFQKEIDADGMKNG